MDGSGNTLNLFGPDNELTRAELVKMLVGCEVTEQDLLNTDSKFNDVEPTAWYAPYIVYAEDLGWINGYADGSFKPNNLVTRAEAVKIIISSQQDKDSIPEMAPSFPDVLPNEWYSKFIAFGASKGYFSGYEDGSFKPTNNITRAEAAKIIVKALGL